MKERYEWFAPRPEDIERAVREMEKRQNEPWVDAGFLQVIGPIKYYKQDGTLISLNKWDKRLLNLAKHISTWTNCISRGVGVVIVGEGNTVISMGYNGTPRGSKMCNGECEWPKEKRSHRVDLSGCPAVHGENNAIINAARIGASTYGATMYAYCCLPCKACMGAIINAGIKKLICLEGNYDDLSVKMIEESDIELVRVPESAVEEDHE